MPTDSDILLDATGLCRHLGERARIESISLQLARGDVLGLLGLNGAGKSTTLQLLCGVLTPDQGTVRIRGQDLADNPLETRRHIGYLPDLPPLFPELRVDTYLRFAGRLRRIERSRIDAAVDSIIERCNLGSVRRHRIRALSKGFRQRVGLAQALIHEPEVVLLDEPSSGLDPRQMDQMRQLVRELAQDRGVIFSTHLLSEAEAVCSRIAVLHQGRLIADERSGGQDLAALFRRLVDEHDPTGSTDRPVADVAPTAGDDKS